MRENEKRERMRMRREREREKRESGREIMGGEKEGKDDDVR